MHRSFTEDRRGAEGGSEVEDGDEHSPESTGSPPRACESHRGLRWAKTHASGYADAMRSTANRARAIGISLIAIATIACTTESAVQRPAPEAPASEGQIAPKAAEPSIEVEPEPSNEVAVGEPHAICVVADSITDERSCEALLDAPAFEDACEGTAAALSPGPREDLRVLRVACAYGEELWTEEHAVVLLREIDGRDSVLWTGHEIYQTERQSCEYVDAVEFRLGEGEVFIDRITRVRKTGDTTLECEARESKTTTSVRLERRTIAAPL